MKSKKTIVRIIAVVMLSAMIAGVVGCNASYNTNPKVMKVGSVDIDFARFATLYNNTDSSSNPYYQYLQYGMITREQYANYIIDDLTNYGVQMDQIKVQNITLDETEEADLQKEVDDNIKDYAVKNYGSKVDSSIKEADAKAEAAIELLKQDLKDNGNSFDNYRKNIEESLRNNALIEKLRKTAVGEITVGNDDLKKYFEDNAKTSTVASFKSAMDSFINNQSKSIPLAMPHPEKAVEDDPETEDNDETKEANPYGEFFSVQHVLIKFASEAKDDDAKDLPDYASKEEEFVAKANAFEAELPNLTTEQFLDKCHDKSVCEDPGMLTPVYQFFGYLMQEELIDSYYEGFGYAAMKLNFGDEWQPKPEENTDKEASKTEAKEYPVEFFTLSDGGKVAKVFTTVGAHYIIVNPNDAFCMYDEDGYFMLPLYDGENVMTDGEGIVTANGHMTQEQFDAVNSFMALITAKAEDDKADEDTEEQADETTEEPENTEETEEVIDLKAIYDYFLGIKKDSMESEKYASIFKEWKDKTNISVNRSLLAPFFQG